MEKVFLTSLKFNRLAENTEYQIPAFGEIKISLMIKMLMFYCQNLRLYLRYV